MRTIFRLFHSEDGRPLGAMKVQDSNPYFDFDTREEAEALLARWRADRAAMSAEFRKKHWIKLEDDYVIKEAEPWQPPRRVGRSALSDPSGE